MRYLTALGLAMIAGFLVVTACVVPRTHVTSVAMIVTERGNLMFQGDDEQWWFCSYPQDGLHACLWNKITVEEAVKSVATATMDVDITLDVTGKPIDKQCRIDDPGGEL